MKQTWQKIKKWAEGEVKAFDLDIQRVDATSAAQRSPVEKGNRAGKDIRPVLAVICAAVLLASLLLIVYTIPRFGTGETTDNELPQRYVEQGMYEVGAQNLVANMILVYRGFDTFGESTVLYTAATCVIFLLMASHETVEKQKQALLPEKNTTILKIIVKGLFPFVLVFSIYILINGHLSPGGGFSGGSVLGAGLILLDISLGEGAVEKFFNHTVYTIIKVGALCGYGVIILYLVLCGANGIDSGIGTGTAGHIFSAGVILPINVMVGFVVACTMYSFFTYFYRGELK